MFPSTAKSWRLAAASGVLLVLSTTAHGGSPTQLNDRQLDGITAGAFVVFSAADGQSTGLITMGSSNANSVVGSNPSVVNGFGSEGGIATGEATSFGTDGNSTSAPPATSATSVVTGGTPEGNYNIVISANRTSTAGGLTIQGGFTSVYNAVIPGL